MKNITKIINDKYPVHGSIASNQVINITSRQAAHFGYELGKQFAIEFAEWCSMNKYYYDGEAWFQSNDYGDSEVDIKTIFTIFKTTAEAGKTGNDGTK